MWHEPKYWVVLFFCGELLGGGIAFMIEKSRVLGAILVTTAILGLAGVFLLWPESPPSSQGVGSIHQKETSNSSAIVGSGNSVNINPPPSSLRAAYSSHQVLSTAPE